VGWPEVEEDNGHYGQLRHYSDVSLFHNGIFETLLQNGKRAKFTFNNGTITNIPLIRLPGDLVLPRRAAAVLNFL
jgi:hypothetical protein